MSHFGKYDHRPRQVILQLTWTLGSSSIVTSPHIIIALLRLDLICFALRCVALLFTIFISTGLSIHLSTATASQPGRFRSDKLTNTASFYHLDSLDQNGPPQRHSPKL